MSAAPEEEIVTFRLAPRDRAAIQRLVELGEFRNRSDFLRYAIKAQLRELGAAAPASPLPDLEIEGVQLPDAGAPGATRQRGGTRTPRGSSR